MLFSYYKQEALFMQCLCLTAEHLSNIRETILSQWGFKGINLIDCERKLGP